jgi:phosphopantetheinyl transferase
MIHRLLIKKIPFFTRWILENWTGKQVEESFIQTVNSNDQETSAYIVNLQTLQESSNAELFLTEEELATYQDFSNSKRKLHWLGGRVAAKKAIIRLMQKQLQWHDIAISSLDSGRPLATVTGDIFQTDISISHSEGLAGAMAVTQGHCGIDIQIVTEKVSRVAPRFSTEREISLLQNSVPATTEERLTLLWAAKESIRKAAGTVKLPGFLEIDLTGVSENDGWYAMEFNCGEGAAKILSQVKFYQGYGLALTRAT